MGGLRAFLCKKGGTYVKRQVYSCFILAGLFLSACEAPNYSDEPVKSIMENGTEILRFNGNVVEVTDDNVIRVRVPRKGDYIEEGLKLNADGIVEVSLAAVQIPLKEMPFADVTNGFTTNLLEGKEISVEVPKDELLTLDSIIEGYVYSGEQNNRVQDLLLEYGMAIGDTDSPYYEIYSNELERFETAAKNNELGVWALEGFITLSNEFDETFTNIGQRAEEQAKLIEQKVQEQGWSIREQIEKITK